MAVAFRSIGTANTSTSGLTSVPVDCPSGIQAGDLLVTVFAIGHFSGSSVTLPTSLPSGWSTLTTLNAPTLCRSAVYYKIATGSEGSSQTWSGVTATNAFWHTIAQMVCFEGNDTTDAIELSPAEWAANTAANNTQAQTHPTVTPTVDGSGVMLFRLSYISTQTSTSFTSSITSAGAPAGVERSDPSGIRYTQYAIYTRDGGFALAPQSYTTTASVAGNGNGQHRWSIIIKSAPPPPFTAPAPTVMDRVAIQRSYAW